MFTIVSFVRRMSLPGLPPLPKSLSGLELAHQNSSSNLFAIESQRAMPSVTATRKPSTLDTQLAILRREMVSRWGRTGRNGTERNGQSAADARRRICVYIGAYRI